MKYVICVTAGLWAGSSWIRIKISYGTIKKWLKTEYFTLWKKNKSCHYVTVISYNKKEIESSLWFSRLLSLCSQWLIDEAFIPVSICSMYKQLHTVDLTTPVCVWRTRSRPSGALSSYSAWPFHSWRTLKEKTFVDKKALFSTREPAWGVKPSWPWWTGTHPLDAEPGLITVLLLHPPPPGLTHMCHTCSQAYRTFPERFSINKGTAQYEASFGGSWDSVRHWYAPLD